MYRKNDKFYDELYNRTTNSNDATLPSATLAVTLGGSVILGSEVASLDVESIVAVIGLLKQCRKVGHSIAHIFGTLKKRRAKKKN